MEAFPCLSLAYRALEAKGSLPVVLNAANEVAVARFLEGRVRFTAIPRIIEDTMGAHHPAQVSSIAEVRSVDRWARDQAHESASRVELGSRV
jgi:1-deoxy-D-xylulose-5-phosphate reductoisomerase